MAEHSLWTGPAEDPQRYRVDTDGGVLEPVGDGGEGLVFHAIRVIDGEEHDVALKMLTTVALDQYDTLAARSHSIADVHHPHLMRQIEVFIGTGLVPADELATSDTDVLYSTSEWVPGTPFPDAVADTDLNTALEWVCQIADAVQALHDHRDDTAPDGIVHRDVKPTNIRITPDNQAVLIDYGIARPHDNLEYTKASGTYGWRPPELLGGPGTPGPPIDAWGLGAVAYWTTLGTQPPLEEAAAARIRLTPPLKEHFGTDAPHIAAHIATLLEANPDNRPTNLTRWATQLHNLASGRARRRRRLARIVTAALGFLALISLGLFGASAINNDTTQNQSDRKSAPREKSRTTTPITAGVVVSSPSTPQPPPLTAEILLSAPVPAECRHPAGQLVNGELPDIPPNDGVMKLAWLGDPSKQATHLAFGDLTGDGITDAATVLYCNAGGVSWPEIIAFYAPGPVLLGSLSLADVNSREYRAGENASVYQLRYEAGQVEVTWLTQQESDGGCCPTLDYTATLGYYQPPPGSAQSPRVIATNVQATNEVAAATQFVTALKSGDLSAAARISAPGVADQASELYNSNPAVWGDTPSCLGYIDPNLPSTVRPFTQAGSSTYRPASRVCFFTSYNAGKDTYVVFGMSHLGFQDWRVDWVSSV